MRQWVSLSLLLLLFLSGCATAEPPEPELILRYADVQPENYPTTMAAEYFAQLVEEQTQGMIQIRVFPNGELGDELNVFEQVRFGGIDMARISTSAVSDLVPKTRILQLPYLFRDSEHMWQVLDGEIGDELLDALRQIDVIGLSWFDAGTRNFYACRPIQCLEDLSGMRIRVQESAGMSQLVRLLGATPVQLPYSGTFSALQKGLIDGAENNLPSYESSSHFEAAPYYLLDQHSRIPEVQIISTAAMDKIKAIDESYEEVILHCAKEATLYERELWKERDAQSEAFIREKGCVITELSDQELKKFRDAVQPMYDAYFGKSRELINRILDS